ncbi:unnamed protein product [Cylicocyclus nassatus]|uniref:Uncharacterized protein n=1 Tax=Cylicocyclus nassatus TaxID=53992 RepID=A0AA36DPR6_CYLNA|nr:unnamed protein product [Cylicocyclus nassatus]
MTEFRRLACCVTRPWSSKSCSVLNKSFVNTRSVIRDDELLDPMDSPQIREPLLNMTHDSVDCKLGICASMVSTRAHSVANNGKQCAGTYSLFPDEGGCPHKIIKEDQVDFVDADIEMGAVKKKSAAF